MADKAKFKRAVRIGDLEKVRELIKAGVVGGGWENGGTALMYAAWKGYTEIARALIDAGEAGKRDENGRSALMIASLWGHRDIVEMLIDAGEAGMQDKKGRSALVIASIQGHRDIAEMLIAAGEAGKPTYRAYHWGPDNRRRPDFNSGHTAMIYAAIGHHAEIVRLLVPHEARESDESGTTALMHAAEMGDIEIARLLIPHECGLRDMEGRTAIMRAASFGHIEIVRLLIPHEYRKWISKPYSSVMFNIHGAGWEYHPSEQGYGRRDHLKRTTLWYARRYPEIVALLEQQHDQAE